MKQALLCIMACTLPFASLCQDVPVEWAEPGTKWTYEGCYFDRAGTFPVVFESLGDTLLGGKSCRILGCPECQNLEEDEIYLYQSGDTVFRYYEGSFNLLYNFSLGAGDTLEVFTEICDGIPLKVRIDSVSTIQLGDQTLRVQYISEPHAIDEGCNGAFFSGPLVEKIGDLGFFIPQFGAVDPPLSCGFIGYEDPSCIGLPEDLVSIPLGANDSINVCNYNVEDFLIEVSNKAWISPPNLMVFPNPSQNMLKISMENVPIHQVELFTLFGESLGSSFSPTLGSSSLQLDVSPLSPGIYLLKIEADRTYRSSFVKRN